MSFENEEPIVDDFLSREGISQVDDNLAFDTELEIPLPKKPSLIFVFLQAILSFFFDWLSPVIKIYESYKEKEMLGIFILTIVGITLTLAGFGYLW